MDVVDITIAKSIKFATNPPTQKCVTDSLFILNIQSGPNEALCDLQNYTGTSKHQKTELLFIGNVESEAEVRVHWLIVSQYELWYK